MTVSRAGLWDFDGWTISISRLLPFVCCWREGMFAICRSESVARIDCPSERVVAHHNDSSLGIWTALQRLEWSYMFVLLIRMTCRLFADAGGTWGLIREEVRPGVMGGGIDKVYRKEDPPVRTFFSVRCRSYCGANQWLDGGIRFRQLGWLNSFFM